MEQAYGVLNKLAQSAALLLGDREYVGWQGNAELYRDALSSGGFSGGLLISSESRGLLESLSGESLLPMQDVYCSCRNGVFAYAV